MTVTHQTKRWIGEQLSGLNSVRLCTLNREGFFVVNTWGGGVIHIYTMDELSKPRSLKKILQETTRVGIGTLFIPDAALLPADGERTVPDETLLGLHALYKDKVYTIRVNEAGKPQIGQVHFKSYGRGDEREIWYGPDIDIRALPCYRVLVKSPAALKGEWQVANFGSEAFWKHADYTMGRDHLRKHKFTAEGVFRQHTWTNSAYTNAHGGLPGGGTPGMSGGSPNGNGAPKVISRRDRCYTTLGLPPTASADDVKAAFRRLARELHPDVSKLPAHEAKARFQAVYEAYKFIRDSEFD
jgi:hypothetical protein